MPKKSALTDRFAFMATVQVDPFTASQPSPTRAVSGEVSSSVVVASNVPLRFQRRRSPESSQAHLTRVSTLSGQGISLYPASYAGIASGGASL